MLASTSICYWGDVQVNLRDILRVAQWLYYKSQHVPACVRQSAGWFRAAIMANHVDPAIRNNPLRQKRPQYFYRVMYLSRYFEKTEPRDSIFAILGLMEGVTIGKDEHAALLEVDYTKPLSDVLRDATRYALCQDKWLEVLTYAYPLSDQPKDDQAFSSWTARTDLRSGAHDQILFPGFYSASEGLDKPSLLGDMTYGAHVLLLEGIVVGQVIQTTPIFTGDTYWSENLYTGLIKAKEIALRRCSLVFHEGSNEGCIAMALTIIAAETTKLTRAQPEDVAEFGEYLASVVIDEAAPGGTDADRISQDVETLDHISKSLRFSHGMHRLFFATSEGHMGLGPKSMQPDDLVVILRGAIYPFILRNMEGYYQLVGTAYVHGIMDGEAVEAWKAKAEPERIFPIW
jgi:hypothetical protein